ncbi:MAG: hypothetical protein QXM10_02165 [Metallosphaera sp.]
MMNVLKVTFGTHGDRGILPILYALKASNAVSNLDIQIDIDLLYDSFSPTIEFRGVKITLDYLTEDEIREQVMKLLRGEFYPQRSNKHTIIRDDKVISDGALAS